MVRQISVVVTVPDCTVQGFHEAVFQSPETLRNYHKNAGDPVADVPDWEDDVRVISFAVPLSGVPEVVKKAIGASMLTIKETQCRRWGEAGELIVTSNPVLDIVGGSKFTTKAGFYVQSIDGGTSCQVTATVTCEAAGPWGLVSTIEGIMAQQAEASVKSFLNFCAARCAASPEVQLLPDYASDTDTLDVFQDAAESLTTMTSSHVSGVDMEQLEPILDSLELHARGMQETIHSLCAALGSSAAAAAPGGPTVKPQMSPQWAALSPAGHWWPLLLAFMLGCCLGAFCGPRFMYRRL